MIFRSSSLSDETLNLGLWSNHNFQGKLLTSIYSDEAGDYAVTNVLSTRDQVFRPDISDINWPIAICSLMLKCQRFLAYDIYEQTNF